MDYITATAKLGNRSQRYLNPTTTLARVNANTVGVRLSGVYVVLIHDDGTWTLNASGDRRMMVKNRINRYAPVRVVQRGGEWYCRPKIGGPCPAYAFFDGMKVNNRGQVLNADENLVINHQA